MLEYCPGPVTSPPGQSSSIGDSLLVCHPSWTRHALRVGAAFVWVLAWAPGADIKALGSVGE